MRLFLLLLSLMVLQYFDAISQNKSKYVVKGIDDTVQLTTEQQKIINFRKINYEYNNLYATNAEIGFITPPFSDLGAARLYILTGDIIPHFFVYSSKRSKVNVVITPRVKVRILTDNSFPVRTPSFMPGATFYYRTSYSIPNYKYLNLSVFHHSNGQDGPELNSNNTYNRINGNFATNFIQLGYNWGKRTDKKDTTPQIKNLISESNRADLQQRFIHHYKIGIEYQAFGIADELYGSYGFVRGNFKFQRIRIGNNADVLKDKKTNERVVISNTYQAEKNRTILDIIWIFDKIKSYSYVDISRRLNIELKYYTRLKSSPNISWFLSGGYTGQDAYNVYFEDNYFFLRAGLAAGFFIYNNDRVAEKY